MVKKMYVSTDLQCMQIDLNFDLNWKALSVNLL